MPSRQERRCMADRRSPRSHWVPRNLDDVVEVARVPPVRLGQPPHGIGLEDAGIGMDQVLVRARCAPDPYPSLRLGLQPHDVVHRDASNHLLAELHHVT
eukprot:7777093-Alexandrium_andersonii.AAC.1